MLAQRIDREKKMYVISAKIQTRKDLQVRRRRRRRWFFLSTSGFEVAMVDCISQRCKQPLCVSSVLQDKTKKVKVKKETPSAAAVYKFDAKRKR